MSETTAPAHAAAWRSRLPEPQPAVSAEQREAEQKFQASEEIEARSTGVLAASQSPRTAAASGSPWLGLAAGSAAVKASES